MIPGCCRCGTEASSAGATSLTGTEEWEPIGGVSAEEAAAAAGSSAAPAQPDNLPAGSVNGETPSFNFVAMLARRNHKIPFGVYFHSSDRKCFEILEVDDTGKTAAAEYNARAEPMWKLLPGRFIMSVNGICDADAMESEQMSGLRAKLQICQAMEFNVQVVKNCSSKLGVDVHIDRRGSSIIIWGLDDGLIKSWNARRPELQVEVLDRIVAVNGKRMRSEPLLQMLKDATGETQLVIARPAWEMQSTTPSRRSKWLQERAQTQSLAKQEGSFAAAGDPSGLGARGKGST